MVEDKITDGKRIAQFLASELTGLETGVLARVDVVDADPSVEPTPEGATAYQVSFREEIFATVVLFPDHAEIRLDEGRQWNTFDHRDDVQFDGQSLTVESVAAVKQAVDVLRETLDSWSE